VNRFTPLIITASAGTGKTYRLALEYVRLLLDHFGLPGFQIDSILVLTFTRKATAEIKERIEDHLKLLCSSHPHHAKERGELIRELRPGQAEAELSDREDAILRSVNLALASDRKLLQVMTLDSYIGSIFRNIVKPLRSIGDYELDLQAVSKRMPYLLNELMTPALRARVDALLRRKVSPSLDAYEQFFSSLIDNRWLLYLITRPLAQEDTSSLRYCYAHPDPNYAQEAKTAFLEALGEILNTVLDRAVEKGKDWEELFNIDTRRLFSSFPPDPQSFLSEIGKLLERSNQAMNLFDCIKGLKFYNGSLIRSSKAENAHLPELMQELRRQLANYLVHRFLLPEQQDIFSIWTAILATYDRLIYQYKNMTYSDISWFTLEALFKGEPPNYEMAEENTANEFYQFLSHRSRFILIDEFQDTSLIQFAILKPIIEEVCSGVGSQEYGGLIVVGDEKQSIFGWRGGERDLLLNLRDIFPTLENIRQDSLKHSWRSSPTVMDFINSIFSSSQVKNFLTAKGMSWDYPKIQSAVTKLDPESYLSFSCEAYQTRSVQRSLDEVRRQWVKDQIKPALDPPTNQSVAILCRKGKELTEIQQIMDEYGLGSVYQPNAELPEHHLVAPLLSYLKWLAWKDWLDWLAWLRSDYILIKPAALKKAVDLIWRANSADIPYPPDFSSQPILAKLSEVDIASDAGPSSICQHLVSGYLDRNILSERDQLNLDAFLNLAAAFELSTSDTDKSIPAFLDYLENLRGQDALKQVAIEGGSTAQLLTIHKSKGLQFDRVFVFYNLSGKHGWDGKELQWFARFAGKDFSSLSDFALSYHYGKLLEHSDYSDLQLRQKQRSLLEEMNNLYVAFTRAKTKLHILFTYESKDDWDTFKAKQEDSSRALPTLLCDACRSWFGERREVYGPPATEPQQNDPPKDEDKPAPEQLDLMCEAASLGSALDFEPLPLLENEAEAQVPDRKQLWLGDRPNLIGDLWHYYLSFILRDLPDEHDYARRRTLARYCSLLSPTRVEDEIRRLRTAIQEHRYLFEARWDRIFTELPLFHQGRELRLDRLMLDTHAKEALIVDFKTGGIYETEQLERYRTVLAQLPVLRDGAYRIEISYIQL